MKAKWWAAGAVLLLLALTVGTALAPKKKTYATYGTYGGGPPYFEGQVTPVPEPSCFCIAGVCLLAIAIVRKKLKKK